MTGVLDKIVSKDIKLIMAGDDRYFIYEGGVATDEFAVLWKGKNKDIELGMINVAKQALKVLRKEMFKGDGD